MRRLLLALLLSAACLIVSYFGFFYFRDNFSTFYPIKVLSAQSFRAGEIPWWNFADGGGQPLAGAPHTLTFYPDNILYLLLPAHVAFNLHFLLHLVAAWFAMRALVARRAPVGAQFAAWLYVLCGVALSATAFYNLITAVALIPFALWAAERKSALFLGTAFGLLALSTEPVTILATTIAVAIIAFRRMPLLRLAGAVAIAVVIASPVLVAYSEIAREVERAHGYSAQTVLNASLTPLRLAELVIGPVFPPPRECLFVSLFIGVIIVPALFQRSRYTVIALLMLFLALGSANPLVAAFVRAFPAIRIGRYPEKFVMVAAAALVVLAGMLYGQTAKEKRHWWLLITFVPMLVWLPLNPLIDAFSPYRVDRAIRTARRVWQPTLPGGQVPSRADYRLRALHRDPLFGSVAGIRYALVQSSEGMHSLLSRIAVERWNATHNPRWLAIATAPPAMILRFAAAAPSVNDAVERIESSDYDVAPISYMSAPNARVTRYEEKGQTITIDATGPSLLMVNQSYFRAWVARSGTRLLRTEPVDLDRLGILVPGGAHHIELRFGRRRTLTIAAWLFSSLALLAAAFALRVEVLDRGAGEVERAADEDVVVA
jgi:hypothetical protein